MAGHRISRVTILGVPRWAPREFVIVFYRGRRAFIVGIGAPLAFSTPHLALRFLEITGTLYQAKILKNPLSGKSAP
jgi:hypothetical protein